MPLSSGSCLELAVDVLRNRVAACARPPTVYRRAPTSYDSREPVRIVGVAADMGTFGRQEHGRIKIYTPFGRFPLRDVAVLVRTDATDPALLAPAIRAALSSVDARLAIYDVAPLRDKLNGHVAPRALTAAVLGLSAALASALAAFGIYTIVSYATLQRRRELMIRVMLGARPSSILLLLLRKGLLLAATGIVLGLAATGGATRMLSSLLFGISPSSASAYVAATGALAAIVIAACAMPAWRARTTNPALAVRND